MAPPREFLPCLILEQKFLHFLVDLFEKVYLLIVPAGAEVVKTIWGHLPLVNLHFLPTQEISYWVVFCDMNWHWKYVIPCTAPKAELSGVRMTWNAFLPACSCNICWSCYLWPSVIDSMIQMPEKPLKLLASLIFIYEVAFPILTWQHECGRCDNVIWVHGWSYWNGSSHWIVCPSGSLVY